GKPEVENHQLVSLRAQQMVGVGAVVGAVHRELVPPQGASHPLGERQVVFDEQNAHAVSPLSRNYSINAKKSGPRGSASRQMNDDTPLPTGRGIPRGRTGYAARRPVDSRSLPPMP